MLREELQQLHEPGSYVGEVVKVMSKTKVLVKARPPTQQSRGAAAQCLVVFAAARGDRSHCRACV